jgi:uncharacterized protein (AIM24 family)
MLGDLLHYQVGKKGLVVQAGSYLASTSDVILTWVFKALSHCFLEKVFSGWISAVVETYY